MRSRHPSLFLLAFFSVSALTLSPAPAAQAQPDETSRPPNFIVIFTDDQGYGDLGCFGSPNIETPHIDRMAAEGIRFTAFYAAPFCGPSRAQLMTGSYPPRVSHAHNNGPGSRIGLHPGEITIADALQSRGYATMHIGKWHLGDAPEFLPTRQGFDQFFGIPYSNDMWHYHPKMPPREDEDERMKAARKRAAYTGFAGEGSYYAEGGGFPNKLPLMRNEEVIEEDPDQRELTTIYTAEAQKFIGENQFRPFFVYLAHAMPHVPLFVSKKFDGKSARGLYGDVISEIDWSTGQILERLKELDLDRRTLVVFTSDNGPWLGYGIDGGSAGPLRDGKGSTWEGGVRVPGIMRWPGHIPGGIRTTAIAGTHDLLPTFAHLAGADLPADRVIDGRNLWPLLSGETSGGPHEFFHYFAGGGRGGRPNFRAIRNERWKLILAREGEALSGVELYDLGRDVGETRNRIEDHPEIARELEARAREFIAEFEDNIRPVGNLDAE